MQFFMTFSFLFQLKVNRVIENEDHVTPAICPLLAGSWQPSCALTHSDKQLFIATRILSRFLSSLLFSLLFFNLVQLQALSLVWRRLFLVCFNLPILVIYLYRCFPPSSLDQVCQKLISFQSSIPALTYASLSSRDPHSSLFTRLVRACLPFPSSHNRLLHPFYFTV